MSILFLSVWLTTQNHSTLVTERSAVPFLPVNPEYSATRNQVMHSILADVFEVCLGGGSSLLLPPCVSACHFHAGLFLMEAQRRDDIWVANDMGLKIDNLWLCKRLRLRFGRQTNELMFSSCVTAADAQRLPPPQRFQWHPRMTLSVPLLEIVILYSETTKCVYSRVLFLRADWPGWGFPVLLRIHEDLRHGKRWWEEGHAHPVVKSWNAELLMWQCFPVFNMSMSPSTEWTVLKWHTYWWATKCLNKTYFRKTCQFETFRAPQKHFLYRNHSYKYIHPPHLSCLWNIQANFVSGFSLVHILQSFNLFFRISQILPKCLCKNVTFKRFNMGLLLCL